MKLRLSPYTAGVLQAAGIAAYILFLDRLFYTSPFASFPGSIAFLLILFCFSALFCAAMTITYPVYLLTQRKTREAMTVFLSMVVSMGILFAAWIVYVNAFSVSMP